MTENKAVGKITLLIHTRGRKKTTINFNSLHLNVKFDYSFNTYSLKSYNRPDMVDINKVKKKEG